MKNINLAPHETKFLDALAEFLVFAGADRAADAIYEAIGAEPEDDCPAPVSAPAGEWGEVFAD
ncbi:hypothetical protein [Sphingopyxis indica]|uniref:Uncharacterized protein n=1 Tax=Sphingopyxis indica TaxID=436663 RepID=A0A239E393_9SPHN|nr:hypothetical protein [Sphingopyxis indica]SNS38871.1 hypothetical protein SAMN06295955_101566 [Sphingopyxis indica]